MTNRNNKPSWETEPRTTKAQDKFYEELRRIKARPGARSSTGMINPRVVSTEEARLLAAGTGPPPGPSARKPTSLGEVVRNITSPSVIFRTAFTEKELRRLPGWLQPIARAGNELTSPASMAFMVATAGGGPVVAQALRSVGGPKAFQLASRVLAMGVEPITRGGFGQRLGSEVVLGLGAGTASELALDAIPETAPTPLRVAGAIGAGLLGGVATIGGIAAAPAALRATRAGATQAGADVLRRLPTQEAFAAIRLEGHEVGARITKFLDPELQTRWKSTNRAVEAAGMKMDALAGTRQDEFFIGIDTPKGVRSSRYGRGPDAPTTMPVELGGLLAEKGLLAKRLLFKSFDDVDAFLQTGEYKALSITSPLRKGTIEPLYVTAAHRIPEPPKAPVARFFDDAQPERKAEMLRQAGVDPDSVTSTMGGGVRGRGVVGRQQIHAFQSMPEDVQAKLARLAFMGPEEVVPPVGAREAPTAAPTPAARATPQTISYTPALDIRNIDALPRGTGARYLVTIRGQGEELVAARWARVIPKRLKANEVLVDMKGEDIAKSAVIPAAPTPVTAAPTVATRGFSVTGGWRNPAYAERTWSIKNDGSGASMVLKDDGEGYFIDLITPESLRRQGFAEALIRDGIRYLSDSGATSIRLYSEGGVSRELFKKLGFKETGVRTRLGDREQFLDRDGIEALLAAPTPVPAAPAAAPVVARLPRELAGAKPNYNMGQRQYAPQFESDVDRALFIVSQTKKSARDESYMEWLRGQLPDLSDAELRAAGRDVRAHIKATVSGKPEGDVTIPTSRIVREAAPTPAARAVAPEDLLTDRQFKARDQAVMDAAEEARQAARRAAATIAEPGGELPTPRVVTPAATQAERLAEQLRAIPGYRGRTEIAIGGKPPVVVEVPSAGPGGPGRGAGEGGGRRGDEPPTTVEGDPLPIPPEIDAMPEGITRDLALAEEKIRQAEPGAISRALADWPGFRSIYRFFVPARNLTKAQHTAWVAKSMSESRFVTEAFGSRNTVFQELDNAFGPGFKTGEKVRLSYIGPSNRARSLLVGRAIDVLPNPEHYVLNQRQLDAIASVRAYGEGLLDMAANQYGVKIGRFPIKENAAFVPNVDVSDDALALMGDAWTAARVGRAKTRVWEDAISRQAYTPSFQPETNLVRLFEASDAAKGNMVAKEVLKRSVGGKTRVEIIDALHPKLRKYKESIATKIQNLRARIETAERESALATRQEKQVRTQVAQSRKRSEPMLERIDELDDEFGPELSYLSGQTRELLLRAAALERRGVVLTLRKEAAAARGIDLAVELDKLTPLLDVLRKRYKSVGIGNNVLVQEGIFRYFPKKDADSLKQLLEVSTNPALSVAWEIRNIAFNLDLSPITGVHLPLAFLADPVGTVRQFLRGTRTAAQKGQFLKDLTPAGLAAKIEGDPTWAEFAAISGRPVGQTATEFAGGILRRIPGYSKANEAMFTAVTYRTKAMYDVLVQDYVKAGVPRNEAIIAASENVHRVIPLMDHALLGQSQARAKLLQSVTISPSFIFRPAELMAEAATALVKAGLKQPLTTKQKMALRTALIMAATIETISVTSAVIDAWRNDKDVGKAAISATDDMAIRLMDGRKIPIGGPYRSLINAMKPGWINKEMDYMVPFRNVPRWAAGKMTPAFKTQLDLIKNKDFRGRRIMTGDFPNNIIQLVAYEFEGAVPLAIGAWVEGLRTGATLAKTVEESVTQFGGTSLYDRPGPWAMRGEWRDELRQYGDIPTDPNKIGTKEHPISRTKHRQRNPMTDAKLFILGEVTSLMSIEGNPSGSRAISFVLSLIREHDLDPDDIKGIRDRKEDRASGRRLTRNPVDRLINLLEEARPVETAPAPQEPTPALPTPTPAMPTQPGPLSTPTIDEFRRRTREYLATRGAEMTPEPVGAP